MSGEGKPLAGRTIVITRPKAQAHKLQQMIEAKGGSTILLPTIATAIVTLNAEQAQSILPLGQYDWLFFTSANGVKGFLQNFQSEWQQLAKAETPSIGTVGKKTQKALQVAGLKADFVPTVANATTLANELPIDDQCKVLFACGNKAKADLPNILESRGVEVKNAIVYETTLLAIDKATLQSMLTQMPDAVIFTSPSTVQGFFENLKAHELLLMENIKFACIGETTAEALTDYGYKADIVPEEKGMEALITGMENYFQKLR